MMKKKFKAFTYFDAEIRDRELPGPGDSEILHVFPDPSCLDAGRKERYAARLEKVP